MRGKGPLLLLLSLVGALLVSRQGLLPLPPSVVGYWLSADGVVTEFSLDEDGKTRIRVH